MIGTKAIAILIAVGVGLLAGLGGIYLYQQGHGIPFGAGPDGDRGWFACRAALGAASGCSRRDET